MSTSRKWSEIRPAIRNPNSRSKGASDVEKNDPSRSRLQLTRSRILRVHDGVHPDPNLAGLHEVGYPGVRGSLGLGVADQARGERNDEQLLFHARLQPFRCGTQRAQCWRKTGAG